MSISPTLIAVGALSELIADAVASAAGHLWKALKGDRELRSLTAVIDTSLINALSESVLPIGKPVDDAWITEVANMWRPAFTKEVSRQLVSCLTSPSGDAVNRFSRLARQALEHSGCNMAELSRTFWVDEFLSLLPRKLFDGLSEASLRDDKVHALLANVLQQRADARETDSWPSSPNEFRRDLIALLHHLDKEARTGRLPRYLPAGMEVIGLSRTVRVRRGVRRELINPSGTGSRVEANPGRIYQLPVERPQDSDRLMPWPQAAAKNRRIMVLADPGLGKSWLIRTETHRICRKALARLNVGRSLKVTIPIPLRCDALIATPGRDLTEKAAENLVRRRLLPERSRAGLVAKFYAGEVVLLLDALDEVNNVEKAQLQELVQSWAYEVGDGVRCVITSRIAGYTGSPLPEAHEVELQAFAQDDVASVVSAWGLPSSLAARILDRTEDPAIAAMTRIPLLLALLCSLASELPASEALPRTRGQLYGRILRWFLTGPQRTLDAGPGTPIVDDTEVDALLEILAPLAFTFATDTAGWVDLMPRDRLLKAIRAAGPAFTDRRKSATDILRELSKDAGVLVPEGDPSAGRSPNYLFLHRTVAEYLVAWHLASLAEAGWMAIIEEHRWFDPDWVEVIPMLGERLYPSAATLLIENLLETKVDPFRYSLFTAIRVLGARPDADQLISPKLMAKAAKRLAEALFVPGMRVDTNAKAYLNAMAYMPGQLLVQMLERLSRESPGVRKEAVNALAGRRDPELDRALLVSLRDKDATVRCAVVEALAGREVPEVVQALVSCLADEAPDVRMAAVRALAGREVPEVVQALLDWLSHLDWRVRAIAVQELAGKDALGIAQALVDRLGDSNSAVRLATIDALAAKDTADITRALAERMYDDDRRIRLAVVRVLVVRRAPEVDQTLLAGIKNKDVFLRRAVVRALAERSAPEVDQALLNCLSDEDWQVRTLAGKALEERDSPQVKRALLMHLSDEEIFIRRAAAKAIARWHDPGVIKLLLDRLSDQDWQVRAIAVNALAEWDTPGITAGLLSRLKDEDPFVLLAAVRALAEREADGVTEALEGCLGHQDRSVRVEAVQALAKRDTPGVAAALLSRLKDQDQFVRMAAVRALAEREADGVTPALQGCLSDGDQSVRLETIKALAWRRTAIVAQALVESLTDRSLFVRMAGVEALAGWAIQAAPEVVQSLLERLDDKDWQVRLRIVETLAEPEEPAIVQALVECLNDSNPDVRAAAVKALAGHDEPEVVRVLLERLNHVSPDVRAAAVKALAGQDEPEVVQALVDRLNDSNPAVQDAAVKGLAGHDEPEVMRVLLDCLNHVSSAVRAASVKALAGHDEPEVVRALLERLNDSNRAVQDAAKSTLEEWDEARFLLSLAKVASQLQPSLLPQEVFRTAKRLMDRHYVRIDPADRAAVRAAMRLYKNQSNWSIAGRRMNEFMRNIP